MCFQIFCNYWKVKFISENKNSLEGKTCFRIYEVCAFLPWMQTK